MCVTRRILPGLKYIAENRLSSSASGTDPLNGVFPGKATLPQFYPLVDNSNCAAMSNTAQLAGVAQLLP